MAKIVGDFDVDGFNQTRECKDANKKIKHEKASWISEFDLGRIHTDFSNAFPDFEATIRRAIDMIRFWDSKKEND